MRIGRPTWVGVLCGVLACASAASAQVTAIRAGRLLDPEAGTIATNQVILVEGGRFTAVGRTSPSRPTRG
jgi:hypothetical protein